MADQGIVQRTLALARYAFTGTAPADWFGPSQPIAPMAPPEVKGRQFDYPVAINLNYGPRAGEKVGFAKLKALAENCDLIRIIMDGQKDKLESVEWTIRPRKGVKAAADDRSILDIQAQLEYPDRNLDWSQWLRALLDQLFVLDAVSIYRRRDLGGRPYSFELLDGATIKVLLDQSGRRPIAPDPAFQQILKGIPAVNYSTEELLYYPQNVRADKAYGLSRIEQIVNFAETQIERLKHQKAFFTHGNLSDGFFEAPSGTTPDQVRQVEQNWNALLAQGDVQNRRVNMFLPAGFKWNAIGQSDLQDTFDEWLARVICFTFSTSPQPFNKPVGSKGGTETQHEAAEAAGIANLMGYVRRIMNRILIEDFRRPDLEFDWVEDREFDPETKAKIEDMRQKNGSLTLNEVRDRNGEEPVEGGDVPMLYTASGWMPLKDVIEPPEPVVPPVAGGVDRPGDPPDLTKAAKDEDRLRRVLSRFLADAGKQISAGIGEKLGLKKVDPSSDDSDHQFDKAWEDLGFDWEPLRKKVEPLIGRMAAAAGKDAVEALDIFDVDVLKKMTERATGYAEDRAAEMVGMKLVDGELVENDGWSIPDATRDMVRSAVTKAMEEGASNDELAKAIVESEAFSKERATVIARTETAKADVQGQIAGWKATGVVAGRQWLASADCCDECQSLDGTIVGLDEEFEGGDAPLHPNCECDEVAVLPEDMPDGGAADGNEENE